MDNVNVNHHVSEIVVDTDNNTKHQPPPPPPPPTSVSVVSDHESTPVLPPQPTIVTRSRSCAAKKRKNNSAANRVSVTVESVRPVVVVKPVPDTSNEECTRTIDNAALETQATGDTEVETTDVTDIHMDDTVASVDAVDDTPATEPVTLTAEPDPEKNTTTSHRFAPIMALEDLLPVNDECSTNTTSVNSNINNPLGQLCMDAVIQGFILHVVDPILDSTLSSSPPLSVLTLSQRCKTLVLTTSMEQRAQLYRAICERITVCQSTIPSVRLQTLDGVCFWLHTHYTNLPHIQKPCFSSL